MNDLFDKIDGLSTYQAFMYILLPVFLITVILCFWSSIKWFIKVIKEDSVVPDKTSSCVRYRQGELAGEDQYFSVKDDPTFIQDDTITFIN